MLGCLAGSGLLRRVTDVCAFIPIHTVDGAHKLTWLGAVRRVSVGIGVREIG